MSKPPLWEVMQDAVIAAPAACGGGAAMTIETATITIRRIRDNDGQPTCRWWDHHCPFLMQSAFGTREHCFWMEGSGKHRPQLERREHGKGTTIPHPCCPVWEVQP